jgi:uncharacterized protein
VRSLQTSDNYCAVSDRKRVSCGQRPRDKDAKFVNFAEQPSFSMKNYHFLLIFCLMLESCATKIKREINFPTTEFSNELNKETSPYLLQHAKNPVNWWAWNDKSLEKAKKTERLMVISIGYAACHWCHVMEHESFEDTAVARVMNKNFINIKIDREERPDIDNIYMSACQLTNENGCGWPLNVITLPNGQPIWVGTYLPKKEWLQILAFFVKAKATEPEKLTAYAAQLTQGIQAAGALEATKTTATFDKKDLPFVVANIIEQLDLEKGGKKGSPKFPIPGVYEFLLKYNQTEQSEKTLKAITTTLDNMANGGIYDHLGGGFARYSTDSDWKVPHFEKMLYDNAQLISLYSHAWQVTKNSTYEKIVRETMIFIEKTWISKENGFFASLDADSKEGEGALYVWKKAEIDKILGKNADIFNEYYEVTTSGNWENGENILHRRKNLSEIAKKYEKSEASIQKIIEAGKAILLTTRNLRAAPNLDDKILTGWNALMLKGCIDAYRAFGEPKYLELALKNAQFIVKNQLQTDGRLNRNYKNGKSSVNGFLEDYAYTMTAFNALYEVTFDETWLRHSEKMANYAIQHFQDAKSGMFYFTSDLDNALIARNMSFSDDVLPNYNSTFALALLDLGTRFDEKKYLDIAQNMMQNRYKTTITDGYSFFYYHWATLFMNLVHPPFEVAIVGEKSSNKRDSLLPIYLPNVLLLGGKTEGTLPLLKDKLQKDDTYIYVCRNKTCKLPVKMIYEVRMMKYE